MKSAIAIAFAATLLVAPPASAQVLDLSTISCKDLFEGNKDRIDFVIVWLLGYYTGEDDPPVIDFSKLKERSEKFGAYCGANPAHSIITAADKVLN